MNITPTIALHLSAALIALAIGPIALWARKGQVQRPQVHRIAGYVWVLAMLITAISAFFIRDFRLPNINGFTFIHALIPWVLVCLCAAFWFLKQGKIVEHRKTMTSLYWGACVGAGLLTLAPDRYLGGLLKNALMPVLSPIPTWVWGLLGAGLLICLFYSLRTSGHSRLKKLIKQVLKPVLFKAILVSMLTVTVILAVALIFGGPSQKSALASINKPFALLDYSNLPASSTFKARDGAALAYLHYPAAPSFQPPQRVVLIHGSSANARSMHALSQGLAASGIEVDALDMRGHGASGERGHIAYIGQLEHDVADFVKAKPFAGRSTLMGFSSGGGFVLRFAGGMEQAIFSDYLLLAPYLRHDAPTARPNSGGWVSVGVPRIIALQTLNKLGISVLNHLKVAEFALNESVKKFLTPSYDYALLTNFAPQWDYYTNIAQAKGRLRVVAGTDDELFHSDQFASVFANAGKPIDVLLVKSITHTGLITHNEAIRAIVNASKINP